MASVKFCSECNNMLYPKEDRRNRQLLFACRNCDHQEEADEFVVFKHIITHVPIEQTIVSTDLANDPTYPRSSKPCPRCAYPEAVFFQSRSKGRDANMKLYFSCCNPACGHRWEEQ
ncbi:hypothetical protein EDD86DRAFT_205085, partial [Gorgonomyces haynaldii]